MEYLVVVRAFGSYHVGDVVTDSSTVAKILASEHAAHVVRIHPPSEG
jgi:hypothetical protein